VQGCITMEQLPVTEKPVTWKQYQAAQGT
jgi:hypothetical protein